MNFLKWLADRAKEPTTYAGLSALGIVFGLPPGTVDVAVQVASAVCAVVAVVTTEGGK